MSELMNDYMALLRSDAKKVFPGAAVVKIVITGESVQVQVHTKENEPQTYSAEFKESEDA